MWVFWYDMSIWFVITWLTCWDLSDWQWCCNSLWPVAHRRGRGRHQTLKGQGFSQGTWCWSQPRSRCCSPGGEATGFAQPGKDSAPLCWRDKHCWFRNSGLFRPHFIHLFNTIGSILNNLEKNGKMSTHTMRSPERRTKESRMCFREEARGRDWQLNVPRWAAWMALM